MIALLFLLIFIVVKQDYKSMYVCMQSVDLSLQV